MAIRFVGLRFLAEGFEVSYVLRSPGKPLVSNEAIAADEVYSSSVHDGFDVVDPRFSECDSCEGSEKVDSVWGNSQLNYPVRIFEICGF